MVLLQTESVLGRIIVEQAEHGFDILREVEEQVNRYHGIIAECRTTKFKLCRKVG